MKENSECKACGKRGHWWTNNNDCQKTMNRKRQRIDNQRNRIDKGEIGRRHPSLLFAATTEMKERVGSLRDVNPIMDERASVSIGGINNAASLCDAFGIPLVLSEPRLVYRNGWRDKCSDAKTVVSTWLLRKMDRNSTPTVIPLDMVEGDSPLILNLDIKRFSDIINLESTWVIKIKRPSDKKQREIITHIGKDIPG